MFVSSFSFVCLLRLFVVIHHHWLVQIVRFAVFGNRSKNVSVGAIFNRMSKLIQDCIGFDLLAL